MSQAPSSPFTGKTDTWHCPITYHDYEQAFPGLLGWETTNGRYKRGQFCKGSGASFVKCLLWCSFRPPLVLRASSVGIESDFPAIAKGSRTITKISFWVLNYCEIPLGEPPALGASDWESHACSPEKLQPQEPGRTGGLTTRKSDKACVSMDRSLFERPWHHGRPCLCHGCLHRYARFYRASST